MVIVPTRIRTKGSYPCPILSESCKTMPRSWPKYTTWYIR
uniref:Uncharacterized protein n=1 Tax=Siphoviridae sp. ct5op20 TaxID=2826295 RepID=A0A8S5NR38_9CAUD|nr:MAG TPA: hypothetical protein [Siphoviridae sp. ct5op20]